MWWWPRRNPPTRPAGASRSPDRRLVEGNVVRPTGQARPAAAVDGDGLRPDLRGVVVELDPAATPALGPGERASVRVNRVRPAGEDDPDLLLIEGDWSGPDGEATGVRVLVYTQALPEPGRVR